MNEQIFSGNMKSYSNTTSNYNKKKEFLEKIVYDNEVTKLDDNLYFRSNNAFFRLFSRNREYEINQYLKKVDSNKDYFIMLIGIANIEMIRQLIDKISDDSRILIIEPNVYILKYILENEDITDIFDSNKVCVLFDYDDEKSLHTDVVTITSLGWGNLVKNICFISLPNMYIYYEKIKSITSDLFSSIDARMKLLGNCLEDVINGFRNNYLNIDAIINNSNLKSIYQKYKGYPAIVVASGPSLEKNIDKLKLAQDKALIITCDASLNACKNNGVKPDAIASIERDEPTYLYYYKDKKFDDDLVLLGPSVLWPKIYEEYKGPKIVTCKLDDGIDKWWREGFNEFYHLNQGLSSANVAFAYARFAGCSPIILVGQDLAYTDEKKHSESTHTEFEGANDTSEFDGCMVEDINGNMIKTDTCYNLFRIWFENQIAYSDIEVIDATEGGAKIAGTKIMRLEEAISDYCDKELPYHMCECLEKLDANDDTYIEQYNRVIERTKKQISILKKIQKLAAKHYKRLEDLIDKDINNMTEEQLIQVIKDLQYGEKVINRIKEEDTIITYFKQIIQQTVIAVKQIGNELNAENVIMNIKYQGNLMGMIKNSISLIVEEYKSLIETMEQKKKERIKNNEH